MDEGLEEEGLEGVVGVPVDEQDVGVDVAQLADGRQPGEAGAEDGDVEIHDEFDGAPPGDDDAPMPSAAADEPEEDQ